MTNPRWWDDLADDELLHRLIYRAGCHRETARDLVRTRDEDVSHALITGLLDPTLSTRNR